MYCKNQVLFGSLRVQVNGYLGLGLYLKRSRVIISDQTASEAMKKKDSTKKNNEYRRITYRNIIGTMTQVPIEYFIDSIV